jgi:hypothetical protein
MKIEATVLIDIDGDEAPAIKTAATLLSMYEIVEIKKYQKPRTIKQNRALHVYFTQLAQELNESGQDMKQVIRVPISWSAYSVKEHLWKPLQKAMLGKDSTTELTTDEIDKVYDNMNRIIGERTGVYVPWPSIESLMNDYENMDFKA